MRLILVNSKQKIAVLASGLVVATSGFVTDEASASSGQSAQPANQAAVAADVIQEDNAKGPIVPGQE